MKVQVVRQFVKGREEGSTDRKLVQRVMKECANDICAAVRHLGEANGKKEATDEDVKLQEKASLVIEYVKMNVALETLDNSRGAELFIKQSDIPGVYHRFLCEGARVSLGAHVSLTRS